jgi:hypothetical protein
METLEVSRVLWDSALLLLGAFPSLRANMNFDRWKKAEGMWHLRVCYSPLSDTPIGIEVFQVHAFSCALMLA